MSKRPTWDETFFGTIKVWAKRSSCMRYNVAAVFTKGKQLLQVGYNGPPQGIDECSDVGCRQKKRKKVKGKKMKGRCIGAHAEMNGIVNAALNGVNLSGCKVYCSHSPCLECAKHLVNLRITTFIYLDRYEKEFEEVENLFKDVGIILRQHKARR